MTIATTIEQLQAAMNDFDLNLRSSEAWRDWDTRKTNLYAIRQDDNLYPVKQVVSMATGLGVDRFNGGTEANSVVEKLGYQVEALHLPSAPETQAALHELLIQRAPESITPQQAYDLLAERFNLPLKLRNAVMPSDGRNYWENRVQWARNSLVKTGHIDGSKPGIWSLVHRSFPIVWLEKTIVAGRPDRSVGDHALGKVLWSPERNKAGDDEYRLMRDVQPGDYVIHLIDNEEIAGVSRVRSPVSIGMLGLPATAWAGVPCYVVELEAFEKLKSPLKREKFLGNPDYQQRLQGILTQYKNVFYNRKLDLNQGFYLSSVPIDLVTLLDDAYRRIADEHLPLIDLLSIQDHPLAARNTINEAAAAVSALEAEPNEPKHQRVWLFAPGRQADHWEDFYEKGIAAMGWDLISDLGDLKQSDITELLRSTYGKENPTNDARGLYEFAHRIEAGDLIIAKLGRSRVIGYGTVTGQYQFDSARVAYRHVRKVRWEGRGDWETQSLLPTKTLTDITPYGELVVELKRLVGLEIKEEKIAPAPADEREPYTVEEALDGLFLEEDEFRKVMRIWRGKKNLIIQGPPGVGKTFIAKRLAYALMGFHDPSRLGMVQFHQSYSYEDFIQGYRPSGQGLVLREGLFVDFCRRAAREPNLRHVFIIDEINRGNLSKVFGELLMLIEGDKRGSAWSIPLAYAESSEIQFYVPENVFVLGLMNTADRSLAMVDYALRRRFAFWSATPQFGSEALRRLLIERGLEADQVAALQKVFVELNDEIITDTNNLGPGFTIGHSYFCRERDSDETPKEWIEDIIETEIGPLIDEYWADMPTNANRWRSRLTDIMYG